MVDDNELQGVPARFKVLRRHMGKTQKEAGEAVGGGLRTWQNYETGRSSPSWRVLEALTRFGVNANWLLTGRGTMFPDDHAVSVTPREVRETAPYYHSANNAQPWVTLSFLADASSQEGEAPLIFSRNFLNDLGHDEYNLRAYRIPANADSSFVENGRIVLIDTADKALFAGRIYAVRLDDELSLVLVQKDHRQNVYLHSGNKYYREIKVSQDELSDLEVVGRAVWADRLL